MKEKFNLPHLVKIVKMKEKLAFKNVRIQYCAKSSGKRNYWKIA